MKKILSLALVFIMLISLGAFAFAEESESVVCGTAAQVMNYVIISKENRVPMRVFPAVLEKDGETKDVYLISLLGVKGNRKQVNSAKNLLPAAFNKKNSYAEFVVETIRNTIPEGSALVFACHSLGGMVAQALRADARLVDNYEIVNVLTAGSPLILVKTPTEGSLQRLADKNDIIPLLSPATVTNLSQQIRSASREDGGYAFDPDGAHNLSYMRDDVWGAYDALGVKNGNATLRFSPDAMTVYGVVE